MFVVRLWDGFDGCWINVFGPATEAECKKELDKLTENGTKNTSYSDIDYYAIYPADTVMLYNSKHPMR